MTEPYDATAVVIDGSDRYEVEIHGLDLRFPKIDTLGDGFVLAGAPRVWAQRRVCRDGRMWMQFDDPRTWYVVEV